jgi:hypothetical protein
VLFAPFVHHHTSRRYPAPMPRDVLDYLVWEMGQAFDTLF